ncbi:ATP-binding cassette domain-containing protein [Granulicatella sp. zg-ZJ]|uniref:ATP-binding cassette domain-containing protein n=1 Tax=Granulicatella sp. zg-ZJ TaxID=2678504 RepID=UPI0013D551C5|nr:ATP-binding cassette domain-containing protein [Granulicatella sp. zg-ZJ]NEW63120.1 ATP-binding cassette domain-containing protein [Granulicatella sp. zg-ZJ]
MFSFFKKNLVDKKLFVLVVLGFFNLFFSFFLPIMNGKFIDLLILSNEYQTIIMYIVLLMFFIILSTLVSYIYKVISFDIHYKFSFNILYKYVNFLLKIPINDYNSYDTLYLSQRLKMDVENIVSFILTNIIPAVLNLLFGVIILTLLFFENIAIFFMFIIFIIMYLAIYYSRAKKIFLLNTENIEQQNKYFGFFNHIFLKNKEIRSHSIYDFINHKFLDVYHKTFYLDRKFTHLLYRLNTTDEWITMFFSVSILIFSAYYILKQKMTIGQYITVSSYFSISLNIVQFYIELGNGYQLAKTSMCRMNEISKINLENHGELSLERVYKIELSDVNFTQESNLYSKNINFCFGNEYINFISGKNGSGKTTLLEAIIGINYERRFGDILLNNEKIENLNMYDIRKNNMSIYLQDNFYLETDTVNSFVLEHNINLEQVKKNKELSELFYSEIFNIFSLKNKKISELSSGERQLFFLFLTVIKEADVFIFDEPTSNMNTHLVSKLYCIFKFLQKKNKIVIVVTHDMKLLEFSENTLELY